MNLNKKGSSLFESLITLSIFLLLFGMTIPAVFKYISKTKLDGSASEVISILKTARNYAITNNKNYEVFFPIAQTGSPDAYRSLKIVEDCGGGNYRTVGEWHYLKEGVSFDPTSTALGSIKVRPFPEDTSLPPPNPNIAVVYFKPNGGASLSGVLSFKFNSGVNKKKIVIDNINGRIKAQNL